MGISVKATERNVSFEKNKETTEVIDQGKQLTFRPSSLPPWSDGDFLIENRAICLEE